MQDNTMIQGLEPILDGHTRFLVLGTFPGAESLAKKEYYSNPRNLFWKITGDVFGEEISYKSYPDKISFLKKHNVGLWDVFYSCRREGSLDRDITDFKMNDFGLLKEQAPKLKFVCFNGKKSSDYAANLLQGLSYEPLILPSTSPANASLAYPEKVLYWTVITDTLLR